MNLPDEMLLKFWRQVQGPHAELNGPLIRFAGLVLAEAVRHAFKAGFEAGVNCIDKFGEQHDTVEDAFRAYSAREDQG